MIILEQYFGWKRGHIDATPARVESATILLLKVSALMWDALDSGIKFASDPDTGTEISGAKGGDGDGGFRLQSSKTGAPGSAHKQGSAVDVYDPGNMFDTWLTTFEPNGSGNFMLVKHGLYREHPDDTPGWCHLQSTPPRSGKRTYRA